MRICKERNNKENDIILFRITNIDDLEAVSAQYHLNCYASFTREQKSHTRGRVINTKSKLAFDELCVYINEGDECQYSMEQLQTKLREISQSEEELYDAKYLKKMILEYFGSQVVYSSTRRTSLFSFKDKCIDFCAEKWYNDRKQSQEEERLRIIKTAAQIIREDIQLKIYNMEEYPTFEQIEDGGTELIPESLHVFMKTLTARKHRADDLLKKIQRMRLFINQALISMCRPRSFLSPLQLGLSVYLERKFGSKQIIDVLNNLGIFSIHISKFTCLAIT